MKTKATLTIAAICLASVALTGCDQGVSPTGKACMGSNNDSLVEGMAGSCKKGDTVATKHPAYVCDFKSTIVANSYNSFFCIYNGRIIEERLQK